MPLYVYEVVLPDGSGGEQFEVLQQMADAAADEAPRDGRAGPPRVRRAERPAGLDRLRRARRRLSDKNLAAKGFTKYVKTGDGRYEKTTGNGPKKIRKK